MRYVRVRVLSRYVHGPIVLFFLGTLVTCGDAIVRVGTLFVNGVVRCRSNNLYDVGGTISMQTVRVSTVECSVVWLVFPIDADPLLV